jgi:hypothetical protein
MRKRDTPKDAERPRPAATPAAEAPPRCEPKRPALDPFEVFTEWASEADTAGYANL